MGALFSSCQPSHPLPQQQARQFSQVRSPPHRPSQQQAIHAPQPVHSVPVALTADARDSLRSHEAKLAVVVGSLPRKGASIYRALHATMLMATTAPSSVVHFESAFRKNLEARVAGVDIERIASGQWRCTCDGEEFVVSIRTEVLGASFTEAVDLLSELKGQARAVRSTLLGDRAQWISKLSKGADAGEFLNDCRRASCSGAEEGPRRGSPAWEGGELCGFCEEPESSARLAGTHACHVTATFRCPGCASTWSSVQARFSPDDERVFGQKCKSCQRVGEVLRHEFCGAPGGGDERDASSRKPHRSDLCEACGSFGNCKGAFFEPFVMSTAIALLTKQGKTTWAASGDVLVASADRYAVAMLPHVVSDADRRHLFSANSALGSQGNTSKPAGKNQHHRSGGSGCFKCGASGHLARNCPTSAGRSSKGGGGKGKSKGKRQSYASSYA
eukprot:TRINITY_DN124143_c0_g1_i1.p1 TRINITY_DN124143_c0_g1~~TRINITY_DN124143_c0_g1_i1.p1  ORF type:complete len:445 (+),score=50.81 TRINITY_DN124143_c0_g1_i1:63-1397(+)